MLPAPYGSSRRAGVRPAIIGAGLAGTTLAILVLALLPATATGARVQLDLDITAHRFIADALANALLFVPFGLLAASCFRGWRPIAVAASLSVLIELAQLGIPGRYTSPFDVVFNTAGAAAGMLLARRAEILLRPPGGLRRDLVAVAAAVALGVLAGGPFLFAPAVPGTALYGQWTAEFDDMSYYEGRVLAAEAGGLALPSARIGRSDQLRVSLLAGDTLRVLFTAGPPPPTLAPIFSIYDERAREVMLIGADGRDVLVRFRMRAASVRLDQPEFRYHGALFDAAPGQVVRLRFWHEGSEYCLATDMTVECLSFTAGHSWALLLFPLPRRLAAVMPVLWIAALLAPAGFWCPRLSCAAGIGLLALLVLMATPRFAPVAAAPALHLVGIVAGLGLGFLAGWRLRNG